MFHSFLIGSEEGGMENQMDLPSRGNAEAENHVGDNFFHFKWACSFHLELFGSIHVAISCL